MAGGNVRVNVLSTTPATSKSLSIPGGQSSSTPVGSKITPLSQSSKVTPAASQGSKMSSSALIESLLATSGGRPVNQKVVSPEQFTKQW